ncbi:MAG: hypothetical protein CMJ35_05065 [Phycisphaerae bacterium]|nr:hypothetical protein [Phycisphaerae bacterium]MBM90971.1 hypothetical protein [Phycisphaerae bacterium]HCT45898.1 hypothetical protein [Phycisphaerales bacterium]|tara:strand:+ start:233 stop:1312 length:1080 start_codon:yes stop_codon:yes gene_type:complete
MITISIGILAYNEEKSIAQTIESVLAQCLHIDSNTGVQREIRAELVVVPNGCKDQTARVAQDAITRYFTPENSPNFFNARVCELEAAGKENAWNNFVNGFSADDVEYLVFMDADVTLAHPHVISNLIEALETNPELLIAGGNPIKHVELKDKRSTYDRLSIGATSLRKGMKGVFAGCLYCGRANFMREMYLPEALMGEDAFVRAMTVTRGFTQPDDVNLVARVESAEIIFQSYTSPGEILRNKTRRMLELTINAILYTKLWAESTKEAPAGMLMKQWQSQDPQWSARLVHDTFNERGFWAVPRQFIYKQFMQLKHQPWPRRLRYLPVAIATLPINTYAVIQANRWIIRGETRKLWDKQP